MADGVRKSLSGASQHLLGELTSLDATVSGCSPVGRAIPVVLTAPPTGNGWTALTRWSQRCPIAARLLGEAGKAYAQGDEQSAAGLGSLGRLRAVQRGSRGSGRCAGADAELPEAVAGIAEEIDRTVKDLHISWHGEAARQLPSAREVDAHGTEQMDHAVNALHRTGTGAHTNYTQAARGQSDDVVPAQCGHGSDNRRPQCTIGCGFPSVRSATVGRHRDVDVDGHVQRQHWPGTRPVCCSASSSTRKPRANSSKPSAPGQRMPQHRLRGAGQRNELFTRRGELGYQRPQ